MISNNSGNDENVKRNGEAKCRSTTLGAIMILDGSCLFDCADLCGNFRSARVSFNTRL